MNEQYPPPKPSDDLLRLFRTLNLTSRQLAQFHAEGPQGMDIADLWQTVVKLLASARIEHERLLGLDVREAEGELLRTGNAPWRDLIAVSSDSPTDELTAPEATDESATPTVSPQLYLLQGKDSRLYVTVPLSVDLTQLATKGG